MDLDLTEETIINTVMDYIEEDIYNYAVMIDGDWGSRKTYFVKNSLIPKIKDKYKEKSVIYVSLYGINTLTELDKQIYMSKYINGDEKTFNVASSAMSLGFDYLRAKGIEINEQKTKGFLRNFLSINKSNILIFDDFERCLISIKEIMGYINQFIENLELKVIVIANEKEIQRDNSYDILKEKTIGCNIFFHSDLKKNIYEIIQNKITENGLKKILVKNIDKIYLLMNSNDYTNLRFFQFCLSKLNIIYKKLFNNQEYNNIRINQEFYELLISYVLLQSYSFKKNNDKKIEYSKNLLDINSYDYRAEEIVHCRCIDEFIIFSSWNELLFQETLNLFYKKYCKYAQEKTKLIYILFDWKLIDEKELSKYLSILKQKLSKNEFEFSQYQMILKICQDLKYSLGIDMVDDIMNFMMSNINKCESTIDEIRLYDNKENRQYNYLLKRLNLEIEKHNNSKVKNDKISRKQFNRIKFNKEYSIFNNEKWYIDIQQYDDYIINGEQLAAPRDIFCEIEVEELMGNLYMLNANGIYQFRAYMQLWQDYYQSRMTNYESIFTDCVQYINNHTYELNDKVRKYHINCLKNEFNIILNNIKIENTKRQINKEIITNKS